MIPFNKIYHSNKEFKHLNAAILNNSISGGGIYSKKCEEYFLSKFNLNGFLTTSCTSSLEAVSLLSNLKNNDEIIMPSFTFVGSATPFVLRGCTPVFVDIRSDTQNIDENLIENHITKKTKAILIVHYAGVACDMDKILKICKKYNLLLIEDAAQAITSQYKDKFLGSFGDFGALSFHDTKNVTSGEGGLLIINNKKFLKRAELIIEKGTDRSRFNKGEIDKYTWRDQGSSFVQSEINASFLLGQLENLAMIQKERAKIWNNYHELILNNGLEKKIVLPYVPSYSKQNFHMFYILFRSNKEREKTRSFLISKGIHAVTHYVPLHSSPAGKKFGKTLYNLSNTNKTAKTILRLPMWIGLNLNDQKKIIFHLNESLK